MAPERLSAPQIAMASQRAHPSALDGGALGLGEGRSGGVGGGAVLPAGFTRAVPAAAAAAAVDSRLVALAKVRS